jgi:hypothetical protein
VTRSLFSALILLVPPAVTAQSIAGAVLAKREPHHHVAYEDATIRVLRVRVPARDTTLLHEHDPDYFWIALGPSTVVNARLGAPDATITSADLSIHYTFGKFAHIARNPGLVPFDNITVELLERQTNARNLCEPSLADKPLDCPAPSARSKKFFSGVTEHPAFTTAQTRVSLVTIAPGGAIRPTTSTRATWMIALDSADAGRLAIDGTGKWNGGTFRAPGAKEWGIANRGSSPIRVIAVVKP